MPLSNMPRRRVARFGRAPRWLHRLEGLLRSASFFLLGRILLTFMFWSAGFRFLLDTSKAVDVMNAAHIEPAPLAAAITITILLVGSAFVIDGRFAWAGAAMLAGFTLFTIPLVHHFWTMHGPAAYQARLECEEHLSVVGGLILAAILGERRFRLSPTHRYPSNLSLPRFVGKLPDQRL